MKISVNFIQKNDEFIANCPELNINCYASNKDDAVRRMNTVINFYIESAQELGLYVEAFTEMIIEGTHHLELSREEVHTVTDTLH